MNSSRTTLRLDDALLRQAKAMAAANGRSLNDFIVDAIRVAIARPAEAFGAPLPTFGGRGLQPGVDLDDTAALLALMEEPDLVRRVRYGAPPPLRRVAERPAGDEGDS